MRAGAGGRKGGEWGEAGRRSEVWLLSLNLSLAAIVRNAAASCSLAPEIPTLSAPGDAQRPTHSPSVLKGPWYWLSQSESFPGPCLDSSTRLLAGHHPAESSAGRIERIFSPLRHQNPYSFLLGSQFSLTVPIKAVEHPLGSSLLSIPPDPHRYSVSGYLHPIHCTLAQSIELAPSGQSALWCVEFGKPGWHWTPRNLD